MSKEIICKVCGKPMKRLGNVSGIIYTSYPIQWDAVYICEIDKTKKTVREHEMYTQPQPDLSGYMEQL